MALSASIKSLVASIFSYLVLAAGFLSLLFLIWTMGSFSSNRIVQISEQAGSQADAYNRRITVALNIRETAARVVAEARLARSRRGMRVPVFPFRLKLNEAKLQLEASMKEGSALWDHNPAIPQKEREAWEELKAARASFQLSLSEFDPSANPAPSPTPAPQTTSTPTAQPAPNAPSAVTPQTSPTPFDPVRALTGDAEFLKTRSELETAAARLSEIVIEARRAVLAQYLKQQEEAAEEIKGIRLRTFFTGLIVAGLTLGFAFLQFNRERSATQRAQAAEGRERSVTDSQRNYILVLNEQGVLKRINRAFLDHFRLHEDSLVGGDYRAALAYLPEVGAFVEDALRAETDQREQRGRVEAKRTRAIDGSEETRLFDVHITELTLKGAPRGHVIVLDDITDLEREREVYRRARTLSAVGQITAQVAHELYNPIGAVKLNLDLLEMQTGPDEDVKHTVGRLKRAVDHLSTIVMDLRYLTKPREPERKQVNLNRLLDDVVELASDRLERTRVRVVREYAATLPEGSFDPQQLRKVFLNLLINAVEASPQSGEIELRTQVLSNGAAAGIAEGNGAHRACEVSIIDHGTGMSPETKRRLFEAFYTTKRNGTGLGMMITQEIIKKHGGQIEVESEEGKGTTVNVKLPL